MYIYIYIYIYTYILSIIITYTILIIITCVYIYIYIHTYEGRLEPVVELGKGLKGQAGQKHRGLHLVQAEGAVLDLLPAELMEHVAQRPVRKRGANLRAKDYMPDLAKMKSPWKMPLEIHWTIPATIHWTSDSPLDATESQLENATENPRLFLRC